MEPIVIARAPGFITFGVGNLPSVPSSKLAERLTVTAAVDYYAYAIITPSRSTEVHISMAEGNGLVWHKRHSRSAWSTEAGMPEAIARLFGTREGLNIFLSAQAPLSIGLGLSGSLTVSMIKALAFSHGLDLEPGEVAALACHVHSGLHNLQSYDPCQYAAACGGLMGIVVAGSAIRVAPLRMKPVTQQSLESQLMLFCAPKADHPSGDVDQDEQNSVASVQPRSVRARLAQDVNYRVQSALERGDWVRLGDLLQHTWLEQCRACNVDRENTLVGALHAARDCGALGGQGTALGSGLLVVLCPEKHQPDVTSALTARGLKRLPLALEPEGVQVMEAMPRTKLTSTSSLQDQLLLRSHLSRTT